MGAPIHTGVPRSIKPPSETLVEQVSRLVGSENRGIQPGLVNEAVDTFRRSYLLECNRNPDWSRSFIRELLETARKSRAEPWGMDSVRDLIVCAAEVLDGALLGQADGRQSPRHAARKLIGALPQRAEDRRRKSALIDQIRVKLEVESVELVGEWLLNVDGGYLVSDADVAWISVEVEAERRRRALLTELDREFEERFLETREWWLDIEDGYLISDNQFEEAAVTFVKGWCRRNLVWKENGETKRFAPTDEQARVIACLDRHAVVEARAGSGKTATMVARAAFLVLHCGVDPASILMLAFNRDAAAEIEKRLKPLLGEGRQPHAMTFAALAKRLVRPTQEIVCDEQDGPQLVAEITQRVVNRLTESPDTADLARSMMMEYFEKDWEALLAPEPTGTAAERIEERETRQSESIKGHWTRSSGEKRIANILFKNGFHCRHGATGEWGYDYERRWAWKDRTTNRPDFTIIAPDGSVRLVIEYFGTYETGNPEYDSATKEKLRKWSEHSGPERFLALYRQDLGREDFGEWLLHERLPELLPGEAFEKLNSEELWERVKPIVINRFARTTESILQRARQLDWGPGEYLARWQSRGVTDDTLDRWNRLQVAAIQMYADELRANDQIDFTGLMWQAVDSITGGRTDFEGRHAGSGDLKRLEHIVIDEFQDFSLVFYALVRAILRVAPEVRVMAVGDEWQAINGFAGATAGYLTGFETHFTGAARLLLTANHRSTPEIVALGNQLMAGRGTPAVAYRQADEEETAIAEWVLDDFNPSDDEKNELGAGRGAKTTAALTRLIQYHRRAGRKKVAVLARTNPSDEYPWRVKGKPFNNFDDYARALRQLLHIDDENALKVSTAHRFKGQQADAVIVLQVHKFPFLHPSWPLTLVFGDTEEALLEDERNLFYVAVSRPQTHLDVVVSRKSEPGQFEFWAACVSRSGFTRQRRDWSELYGAFADTSVDCVYVTVRKIQWMSDPRFETYKATMNVHGFRYSTVLDGYSRQFAAGSQELVRFREDIECFPELTVDERSLN